MTRLRHLAEHAALWLFGDRPTGGYVVPSSGWPGGVRDSDLTVEQVYAALDDAFDNHWDTAVRSMAAEGQRP